MTDIAIRVENLSKLYHIGRVQQRHDTLRDALVSTFKRANVHTLERSDELWALRDVSFEVKRGEVVGIIGRNGAGKSTLLKILSRITEPTRGRAEIHGRVGSLLEVGTGFHPELTGRENIFLNGAILGMKRAEIERRFDEIVAFAEIEPFLDTPVKRYSSGMYVRLAFAVAAHLEPEILLVDEVLAVGDYNFQQRCLKKMDDVAQLGRTVLFVSHNMAAVGNLTQRALVLQAGRLALSADSLTSIDYYLSGSRDVTINTFAPRQASEKGGELARIVDCQLRTDQPQTGKPFGVAVSIERSAGVLALDCDLSVSFLTAEGAKVLQLYSSHMGKVFSIGPGITHITAIIDSLPLVPGTYRVNLWLGNGTGPIHWLEDCMTLRIEQGFLREDRVVEARGYPAVLAASWSVTSADDP